MALKRISGLWLRDGKNGKYLSGNVREPIPAGSKLLIFPNSRKQSDANPDYVLNLAMDGAYQQGPATDGEAPGDRPSPPDNPDNMPF
jgi:hypothetical protein